MPGKRFQNAVPACALLRNKLQNGGVLARSVTKIPLARALPFLDQGEHAKIVNYLKNFWKEVNSQEALLQ
jgi:hypothetical protein